MDEQNIEKIDLNKKIRVRKTAKKNGWKRRGMIYGGIAAVILLALFFLIMTVNTFFESYHFVFRPLVQVKFNQPVSIEAREIVSPIVQEATPSAEPAEQVKADGLVKVAKAEGGNPSADLQSMVKFAHWRESNNGTAKSGLHVTCRAKGMINEYGYNAPNGFCFRDETTQDLTIHNWFYDNMDKYGVAGALCRYNTGRALSDCQYYQDYLAYTLK